jgi:UbiD family decarboxylase
MKGILDVALPESAGGHGVCVVRMDKSAGTDPMAPLRVLADLPRAAPKILIAVDDDINAWDADSVNWAMSYRIQPHRDIEIRDIQASTAWIFPWCSRIARRGHDGESQADRRCSASGTTLPPPPE